MKRPALLQMTFLLAIAAAVLTPGPAAPAAEPTGDLAQSFAAPPDASKPWAYWWWLNANVTRESITRDLEGMKAKGLGGFLLFDVTAYGHHLVPAPERKIAFMSPEWRKLVHFAMTEADRLGLEMSMNLSTCGGALQAPWPTEEHAPKQLVWTVADVTGPARVDCKLKQPETQPFWPVAVVAAKLETSDKSPAAKPKASADVAAALSANWTPVMHETRRGGNLVEPDASQVASEVIDLTAKVDATGHLVWDAPEGQWKLYRFGCNLIPGRGEDVDIINREAVLEHFNRMGKAILDDAGPLAGKTLTHFYNVSWEGTSPSWTPGFDEEFHDYRGYNIHTFLPVLAGLTVHDRHVSERFQADYCRTLSDCFLHNSYEQFTELCHQNGVKWHSESGGPWRNFPLFQQADQFAFWGQNDMPQGEFWWPNYRSNARRTAMAAHIYGKPLVSIESFTHMQPHWTAYPASLKPCADQGFCDGMNQIVWHTFSASPVEFGQPGIVYFAGTHLNPNVTWWPSARPYLDYLARCQHMLRQGDYVADVCAYTTTRNQKNWGREDRWFDKTTLPMPKGYTYDLLDTEVLVERLAVENGDLVLPGGMRYKLLVIDLQDGVVPPRALEKILALSEAGATVVLGPRQPERSDALTGYPKCDILVRQLAAKIWGPTDAPQRRTVGTGRLLRGLSMEQALAERKVLPDCVAPCDYIHRRSGEVDVYFLAGAGRFEATFRAAGREPELWDPMTGEVRDAVLYRTTADGRTVVPIELPENGSVFVVFRKPAHKSHLVSLTGPEGGARVEGRGDMGAKLQVWQNGAYQVTAAGGSAQPVEVEGLPEPMPVDGEWEVRFAPGWGAPESITFDRLIPWNEHPNEAIRHFSGTATYRKSLQLTKAQAAGLVRLDLGQLKHVARVRLNGQDLGILWTTPWAVDLTGVAKEGKNELEVDVTNLWANRLIGDAGLPPEKRKTKTNIKLYAGKRDPKLMACQGFASEHPLLPSGLLGPVNVQFGKAVEVAD